MTYLARRLINSVLLLIGVSILCFLFSDLAPGNFLDEMKLNPQISPDTIAALRSRYGLDQPMPLRYVHWVKSIAQGDWGYSFAYNSPVRNLLAVRARNTLILTSAGTLLAWLIALPIGIWTADRCGAWGDRLVTGITSLVISVPELALAVGLLFLAVRTRLLPLGGMVSLSFDQLSLGAKVRDLVMHLALPVTMLVLSSLPILLRHVRAQMIEVLKAPFVQAAVGYGIGKPRLLLGYALPAAANPLISLFGLSIGGLLSGSLLIEVITGWPGLGPLLLESSISRDFYVVMGVVTASAIFMIAGSLLADIMLLIADPRIRTE